MSRPFGVPKTEEERKATHKLIYGSDILPPRGTGFSIDNPYPIVPYMANRDYPYHDYHSDTTTSTYQSYRVGEKNIDREGDQKKLFVSKSLLIMATTDTYIKLNHGGNVIITLLANNWYEFKSNITTVYYAYVSAEGTIYIIPEGVLPNEQRDAE